MSRKRPWEAEYPPHIDWHVPVTPGTLPGLLEEAVARWGDRPVLSYRGWRIDRRGLGALVNQLAAGFLAAGLGQGTTVALYLPNTPWHPLCFFALAKAGARVVHLSALDARRELAHKLHDSGATALITTDFPSLLDNVAWLLGEGHVAQVLVGLDSHWAEPAAGSTRPVEWGQGLRPLDAFFEAPEPAAWPKVTPDQVALLQYTGGTTGMPKGAMLTHGNLTSAVAIYRAWVDLDRVRPGEERVLAALPLFHIYALTSVLLRHIADGNEVVLRPRFDAATVADDIEAGRITNFPGVPTMWIALLNLPGIEARTLSALRSFTSGGAPMPNEVSERLSRLLGGRMGGGWGMTETCPAGTRITPDAPSRPGMIGLPLPAVDMRVVSLENPGQEMPVGETGEIAVRGPNVFQGYWQQPAENARCFHDDWFLTGDIGWMDERGFFTLVDRRKNMIISSGFNVYPAAIEQAIYEHPDVAECIVIGVPDEYRGQAAKAFVTLKAGAEDLTLDQLRLFLVDRVGRHEMPAALEIRDALPRSPVGKLLASALRDEEAAKQQ